MKRSYSSKGVWSKVRADSETLHLIILSLFILLDAL